MTTAFVLSLALAVAGAGCNPGPAIGGSCDPGAAGDSHTTTISSPALECQGRTCVQANGGPAFCSAECSAPEDCQDISPGGTVCRTGFTCAVAARVGPFACRKLCVCRDDADTSMTCSSLSN